MDSGLSLVRTSLLLEKPARTLRVECSCDPKGPGKRPAALGLGQTAGFGVQPRTPARQSPTFIDDQTTVHRDQPPQLSGPHPLTTSHTRTHRTIPVCWVCGSPLRVSGHYQV
jgi:hypothetical protein